MLPLHNEQFKQKYTNLCFNRYYETPSKKSGISRFFMYLHYYWCDKNRVRLEIIK